MGLGTRGARVVAVPRIEAVAVEGVRVPNPLEVRTLERVRLSFDVQMTFHAKVERFEFPQAALPQASSRLALPTDEIEVDRLVRVEASSDPKFETFSFESASLIGEVITPQTGTLRFGA